MPSGRPQCRAGMAVPLPGAATRWQQLWRLARFDMAFVFRSPAFFVLLGIGMLNSFGSLWYAGQFYGGEVFPVTRLMVVNLNGAFTIIPIIIAIFYAGELVWRDRDRRVHEIVDATPAPDWTFIVPKVLAITLVLAATLLVAMLAGVVVQALKGYTNFELLRYLQWFVLPGTALAVLFAVLSVFVQVLVPHKFLGWAVDAAVSRRLGRLREHRARAQPVPVRRRTGNPVVGHERHGAVRRRALCVPRVLGAHCADAGRPRATGSGCAARTRRCERDCGACRGACAARRRSCSASPPPGRSASAAGSTTTPMC